MKQIGMVFGFLALLLACDSGVGPRPPSTDSDAGVIRRADAGPIRRADGGAALPGIDAGDFECEPDVVPAPTGAACATATRTCLEACTDEACYDGCMGMDPAPDACGECLDSAFLSCANSMGCQTQWDTLSCCYEAGGTCATEEAAYDACVDPLEPCFSADAVCFM
jgi:hypothetical protein